MRPARVHVRVLDEFGPAGPGYLLTRFRRLQEKLQVRWVSTESFSRAALFRVGQG